MNMSQIFEPIRAIEIPEETRSRILINCRKNVPIEKSGFRKPVLIAAILMIFICAAAAGMGTRGFFRDIRNPLGAITGTEYLEATHEISVQAALSGSSLSVRTEFLNPGAFPWKEAESLSIGSFKILDAAGKTLFKGGNSDPFPVENGCTAIEIPLEKISGTPHTIVIESFVTHKKADQPLSVKGMWEYTLAG